MERELAMVRGREIKAVEQLCRISLAADAPMPLDIEWCEGLGRLKVLYTVDPGRGGIVWPLNRTISYFGPFNLAERLEHSNNEREKIALKGIIVNETARFMNRYDYPREEKTGKPIGPHRAPDVTIEVLKADGGVEKSYRLAEEYGYREFDEMTFERKATEQEIRAHYEAKLEAKDQAVEEMRRETAELRGMIMGSRAAAPAAAPKPNGGRPRGPHPVDCKCVVHRKKAEQPELVAAG